MEEKKFVQLKKDGYGVREFIKKELGKGKISSIKMEYTPVGEKITIITNKPGYVIGRRGERIAELTEIIKKKFNFENLRIEMQEIEKPEFDAQYVADEIALSLERFGSLKFKVVAYKMLERIVKAGALGVEIRLSGKLPGERAKSWRFANGYLKKTGDTAKIVNRAKARADTLAGTTGIKVAILPPGVKIHDQIKVDEKLIQKLKENANKLKEDKQLLENFRVKNSDSARKPQKLKISEGSQNSERILKSEDFRQAEKTEKKKRKKREEK